MMQRTIYFQIVFHAVGVVLGRSSTAVAVPYASGVHNTGGNMWKFVLNQGADSVAITRDGGNAIVMNNATTGRHTFNMAGFSDFEIAVANDAAAGWTTISDENNLFTSFSVPSGLAINTDPSSAFFGTVYVANANPAAAGSGRAMGDGVYSLSADRMGVDLANNFAVIGDPSDTSQAAIPGEVPLVEGCVGCQLLGLEVG